MFDLNVVSMTAGLTFIGVGFLIIANVKRPWARAWTAPLVLCGAFFAWSLFAVTTEGPTGFWPEHVRNRWGVQIWFDLLLAAGISWFFIAPRAKAQGMNLVLWFVAIICTGSIGILAALSRLLYLENKNELSDK